ncbi:histidine phosphatase family protein [Methylophaga sp.]|uniref:histidine phosphatase family protein n=1 Tax=Methylophaga sp. TaxID=2024840 RepID=UPI003A916D02
MSRLILGFIRHGDYEQLADTPSAHQPFALTEQGKTDACIQAQKLCRLLLQEGWQLVPQIDCSNMLRSWQTADIFRLILETALDSSLCSQAYDALAERSVGSVANLTVKQIEEIVNTDPRYPRLPEGWKSDSHFCLPFQGAESLMTAGSRVAMHIETQMRDIPRKAESQLKLCVGHGASFRHAAYHLGVINAEEIAQLSMYHSRPIFLELFVDGTWQHVGGEWKKRSSVAATTMD